MDATAHFGVEECLSEVRLRIRIGSGHRLGADLALHEAVALQLVEIFANLFVVQLQLRSKVLVFHTGPVRETS